MRDFGQAMVLAIILLLVLGGVVISSTLDRRSSPMPAVAAAIDADLGYWIEVAAESGDALTDWPICIEGIDRDQTARMALYLSSGIIRPVHASLCSSKTVEGDFGMFYAMTYWFDPSGLEAGWLKIAKIECGSARRCTVDIDAVGAGMRYEVVRENDVWSLMRQDMRWVV